MLGGGLYVFGDSPLHRARPLIKIAALVVFCTTVFLISYWAVIAAAAVLIAAGIVTARLPLRAVFAVLRPVLWVLAAIFAAQVWLAGPQEAAFVISRFALMILAAALVTLTTTAGEFVEGIEAALKHAPAFVPKERIALVISLSLRFIPLVNSVAEEVRQAQRARGLDRNLVALVVPLVVRMLKQADAMAEAIEARSVE